MDIAQAATTLGLDPGRTHSVQEVQDAYFRQMDMYALWRYPQGTPEQAAAADWLAVVEDARRTFLLPQRIEPFGGPGVQPRPAVTPPSRRLSRGAVLAIVGGSVAVVAGLIVAVVVMAQAFAGVVTEAVEAAGQAADEQAEYQDHWNADETGFTFKTAMTWIDTDQYADLCEYDNWCWYVEFVTVEDCQRLQVDYTLIYGESNNSIRESGYIDDVRAWEVTPFAFGSVDDYGSAWIEDVVCLDPSATPAPSV